MANTTSVTSKNFATKLAAVVKSATTQRDTIQTLVVFALEHYSSVDKNGDVVADSVFLTKLLRDTVAVRSLATGTLKAYIEEHTNLKWTKGAKDAEPAFRKVKGSDFKCDLAAVAGSPWYMHDKQDQAKPVFDSEAYAKRVAKKLADEGVSLEDFAELLKAAKK